MNYRTTAKKIIQTDDLITRSMLHVCPMEYENTKIGALEKNMRTKQILFALSIIAAPTPCFSAAASNVCHATKALFALTPLQNCISEGQVSSAQSWIDQGIDLNKSFNGIGTYYDMALEHGMFEILSTLANKGCCPTSKYSLRRLLFNIARHREDSPELITALEKYIRNGGQKIKPADDLVPATIIALSANKTNFYVFCLDNKVPHDVPWEENEESPLYPAMLSMRGALHEPVTARQYLEYKQTKGT